MNMKSFAYSLLGALTGIFFCALLGINFSNGIEGDNNQQTPTKIEAQPNVGLSDTTLQSAVSQLNLQKLNAQLSLCQSDLMRAMTDAAQLNLNARR